MHVLSLSKTARVRRGSLLCGLPHSRKEKLHPCFPIALCPNPEEEIVIDGSVLFEIQAPVEYGLTIDPGSAEQQGNQKPAQTAVSIQKWVYRLKLDVNEACFDEPRKFRSWLMKKQREGVPALRHEIGGRRNKCGVARASA